MTDWRTIERVLVDALRVDGHKPFVLKRQYTDVLKRQYTDPENGDWVIEFEAPDNEDEHRINLSRMARRLAETL